ncbi:coiled-coil domain-containing protein 85C-like isoform X2 [Liolophura sinensis]|uniref:coiled-coil domain-containing protein 85C-like isoform X2 n=1 Tax=Liolophura sinensis TaxID=3198878 RepID=UPI0031584293
MSGPPTPTKQQGNYRPVTPSPTVSGVSKIGDEDLRRKGTEELVRLVRKLESDYRGLMLEHSNLMKDINRRMQINLLEIRGLKDINQKLQDDNQELRDLCCFLDDDRQRGRKLAREWQRFGRYTASVMRSEVTAYQDKLSDLESKQDSLISDNMELKELCLYLDQERMRFTPDRDEGDGSSNTTTASEVRMEDSQPGSQGTTDTSSDNSTRQRTPVNDATAQYIRQLEEKVRQLEEEKRQLAQKVERNGAEGYRPGERKYGGAPQLHPTPPQHSHLSPYPALPSSHLNYSYPNHPQQYNGTSHRPDMPPSRPSPYANPKSLSGPSKPEAVVHAMKVVWRKLGDVGGSSERRPPPKTTQQNYMEPQPRPQTQASHRGPSPMSTGSLPMSLPPQSPPPPPTYRGPTPMPYMEKRSTYLDDRGYR